MDRRQYLITTGAIATALIAGCSSPETEGDDDSPIDAEPEELIPSADLFGDDWQQYDKQMGGLHSVELEGNTSKGHFITDDNQEGVDLEVTVFESVDMAMSGYGEMRDYDVGAERYFEDVDIASEGHLMDLEGDVFVYFRDANVIGELSHVVRGSSKSEEYAADWHETWRD